MNVLLLTNHLNIGGITSYVLNLSCALKQRGHKVFVGALPGWGVEFLKKNDIYFLKLPLRTKSILSPSLIFAYFILKKFLKREQIGIIHAQTRITQFLAARLSRRLGISYLCTFHGFYRPHLTRRVFPCLGDLSIAISQAVGRHLIEDFNLNENKLRVIYNSIGLELSSPVTEGYAHFKGIPTLGIIARLSGEKGHLVLFSAFKKLTSDYPKARLLVVGSGRKENELKQWVKRENLINQIIFLGNISSLNSIFRILDISILPSSLEGLGFSILEAQAAGVPVVASSVGGITEIIKDRNTGILVEANNPDALYQGIRIILSDTLLREKIVNNARQQIKERFSLEKMAEQTESVYKELIGNRKLNESV